MAVSQRQTSQIWHGQARALYSAGQYRAAVKRYNRALEVDPEDVDAWVNRGHALCQLEHYDLALESFQQALKLAPQRATAWHGQGLVQAMSSYFVAAV